MYSENNLLEDMQMHSSNKIMGMGNFKSIDIKRNLFKQTFGAPLEQDEQNSGKDLRVKDDPYQDSDKRTIC